MRVVICDDSLFDRNILENMLHHYFESTATPHEVFGYEKGKDLLNALSKEIKFDIAFLDMYMEEQTGVELAKELRRMDYKGEIVFVTATDEYIMENYKVNEAAYLRKGCKEERFFRYMDEILKKQQKKNYMIVKRSGMVQIPYADILFVESCNTKCILHRLDGVEYTIYKHLGKIELELQDKRFLRCHQSYLVNMDYVQQVEKCFELITGDIVLIRQHEIKTMKQIYYSYVQNK